MTRRITALLLALLLALSLTACGNPAQTMDTIEKTAQTVQQIAEVLNDTEEDTTSSTCWTWAWRANTAIWCWNTSAEAP